MAKISNCWIKPIEVGMKLLEIQGPVSKTKNELVYMTITKVEQDEEEYMDGRVEYELSEEVKGKKTGTARFWWIYDFTEIMEED